MECFSWVRELWSDINNYYYRSCDEAYFVKILEIIGDNSSNVVRRESAIEQAIDQALKLYRDYITKFKKGTPEAASEALDLFVIFISETHEALEYNKKVRKIVTEVCINWPQTKPDIANHHFENGLIYLLFNLEDPNNIGSYKPAPINIIELAAIEAMRIFKPDFDDEDITVRDLLALVAARDTFIKESATNVSEDYGNIVLFEAARIARGRHKLDEPDA